MVPRPPDWGPQIDLTGWWYSEEPHWEPPEPLRRFLETGLPPVFISFGSMPVADPARRLQAEHGVERAIGLIERL